jgi:hypothetical protein
MAFFPPSAKLLIFMLPKENTEERRQYIPFRIYRPTLTLERKGK